MSFEGYCQSICSNGHYYTFDTYDSETNCPYCNGEGAWTNSVDDTNGECVGYIPKESLNIFIIDAYQPPECFIYPGEMNELLIYRIPTYEETRALRTCIDRHGHRVLLNSSQ